MTEYTDKMSAVPVLTQKNGQVGLLKNMVSDPGWFNRNRTKFENQWRGIRLFLKSNRITETNNRTIAILVYLRGGIVDIYAQKKLDKETGAQDWDEFI